MTKILVIAEKPTAAKRIASALDMNQTPHEEKRGRISYYEAVRNNETIIVVYSLGHLYELRQTVKGWDYPRLEMEWVPRYTIEKRATETKHIIELIKRLAKDVDSFMVATDYDIEGSLIGYLILKYACEADPKKARRMRFSTLTNSDIQRAYEEAMPTLDFPLIESGHVRHEVDWLYGINLTRALTLAIKKMSGWFKIVSTGRVQGPALALVAEQNRRANLFIPLPFWEILVEGEHNGQRIQLEYSRKRIKTLAEAEAIQRELNGQTALVDSIDSKRISQQPPEPFNLSVLQSEAYRHFNMRPSRTLDIAQRLYLDALISYPRTNSQQIPPTIDIGEILRGLEEQQQYAQIVRGLLKRERLTPTQGTKTDPAHPAIHPTGVAPTRALTNDEKKIYDLIVRRFLACLDEDAIKESVRADIKVGSHLLRLRGLRTIKRGWIEIYGMYTTQRDIPLPSVAVGDQIVLVSVSTEMRFTTPPPRYNAASLMKALERDNLGTKSTRAAIVDSLKSRGYVLNDMFEMSTLGLAVYETLERNVPEILSSEFTRRLEQQMDAIQREEGTREEVLREAREKLLEILNQFRLKEDLIGKDLVEALRGYWKERDEIGPCPKCGEGRLMIIESSGTRKRFLGCSRYRDGNCDQTFPLPQSGKIRPTEKRCEYCGYQIIVISSRRRSWETCINWASCPGRKEELEQLQKKRRQTIEEKNKGEA